MSKHLRIATGLPVPFEYVTQRTGILGETGSGKTTTASDVVEELLKNGLPTTVVDPTGAWHGLRSSKDGKSDGYPITILGGDHGDLPLEESAGKVLAELVAAEAPRLVLDLSGFSIAGARRFMTDFAERLYEKNRKALHLVLDEADEFAPQRIPKGGERLYGAIDKIVRKGRIRGLGVTMICQRSAAIAKDILSQCSTLIAHRTSHPLDMAPILEWMKIHITPEQLVEVHRTIAKLNDGEAWVMSPKFLSFFGRVQMRDRETFNSSATPKPGERRIEPKRLAAVDLALLKNRMAETIERAKATDPRELQRQIAQLRAELAQAAKAKPAAPPSPPSAARPPRRVEVPILGEREIKRLERCADEALTAAAQADSAAKEIRAAVAAALAAAKEREHHDAPAPRNPIVIRTPAPPPVNRPAVAPRAAAGEPGPISPAAVRMLECVARRDGLTRRQLAHLSGYTVTGGGFRNTLSELYTAGLVEKRGNNVFITAAGRAMCPTPPAQSPADIREMWRAKLSPAARRMLDVVLGRFPESIIRAELAEICGYEISGGGFRNTLSEISSNDLVTKHGHEVRAVEELVG